LLAEKLSDDILGRVPLIRAETEVWYNPSHKTNQR
jgi:hypothetical protein